MSKTWFTSDLHFGHKRVAEIRGYGADAHAPHRHDSRIVQWWDENVTNDDVVWILGDLSVGRREEEHALYLIKQMPGTKHLIYGNHDSGHPMHSGFLKRQHLFSEVFDYVGTSAHIKSNKVKVNLSHFPYQGEGDRPGERHPEWRMRDVGVPLLHGHTHSGTIFSTSEHGAPQMHVGLDAWGMRFVSLSEVDAWVRRETGVFDE